MHFVLCVSVISSMVRFFLVDKALDTPCSCDAHSSFGHLPLDSQDVVGHSVHIRRFEAVSTIGDSTFIPRCKSFGSCLESLFWSDRSSDTQYLSVVSICGCLRGSRTIQTVQRSSGQYVCWSYQSMCFGLIQYTM